MAVDHRAELAGIKHFGQLVRYLRDNMGWPIEVDDFEEMTFEYTPEELGIDIKNAAKIQEIKSLRRLSANQPWGIFFVRFEPKKLPVVALRRILSQVALKKRASANSAERTAWAVDDLLFVSNYGEGDDRQICFAHFSQSESRANDLPTLKVLGWNNLDTGLHLDAVAQGLTQKLSWPEDATDLEDWRRRWRNAFDLRHGEVIATSKDLSIRLAELARAIRDRIKATLAIESDNGPLTKLMMAFQTSLVHDLDADGFADMYAQTIAYGLLSARIADPHKKTADDFAGHMRTNPFLRELMETFLKVGGRKGKAGGPGIDFDELGVNDVVELLDRANMEAVIRDFGDRNPQEDPVIHFYELFLKEYDSKKRMQRGVFYTPRPVVSYIVRSVDELLRTEFGLEDGLADTATWGEMAKRHKDFKIPDGVSPDQDFVQILDPATGTGTFLVEVIDLIHKTLVSKWKKLGHSDDKIGCFWNDYVPTHLLTRLHGYELLMAPYAIAHLKIGLKLYETGYRFGSEERARIYLTNALEPAHDFSGILEFAIPALAHEATAVNEIKKNRRYTAIVGNPPYAGNSSNRGEWIETLINAYRMVDGQRLKEVKVWLKDDYVKFFRLAEHLLASTGVGTIGYISNNSFFDGLTFRGMRHHILAGHARSFFVNLHGNGNLREQAPDGSSDENVFDILQGVGITLLTKKPLFSKHFGTFSADLYGAREFKYQMLAAGEPRPEEFSTLQPRNPNYFVVPQSERGRKDYERFVSVNELFEVGGLGFQSHRDGFVVGYSNEEIVARMRAFFDPHLSDQEVKDLFDISDYRKFVVGKYRRESSLDLNSIRRIQYRPFDYRYVYYAKDIVQEWQIRFHGHLLQPNLGLNVMRQTKAPRWRHAMVSTTPTPAVFVEIKDGSSQFPLYRYEQSLLSTSEARVPNLSAGVVVAWFRRLGVGAEWIADLSGVSDKLTPEDVFSYIYALLHSQSYRTCYVEFLKIDFPRLPLTGNLEIFRLLANLGSDLVKIHTMSAPRLEHANTRFIGPNDPEVTKIGWSENTVWLDAQKVKGGLAILQGTIGFRGVPEEIWNFHIGGYQVCEKWLKDRKGRTLAKDDIAHYKKIIVAISETIRLMKEIDEVIEEHGGWPGAFVTDAGTADSEAELSDGSPMAVAVESGSSKGSVAGSSPREKPSRMLLQAAEPQSAPYKPQPPSASVDREDLICLIRQIFTIGGARSRETAIRELATELGYERVGLRIREEIENAIRAAVRRGIVLSEGEQLRIDCRSIEDYQRDFLKDQFLASLQGRAWADRDEAIRGFARWLGFRRTGPSIDEAARSLVRGLLKEGRLESDGPSIRRAG